MVQSLTGWSEKSLKKTSMKMMKMVIMTIRNTMITMTMMMMDMKMMTTMIALCQLLNASGKRGSNLFLNVRKSRLIQQLARAVAEDR